jgi:glycosyltransferase involved in cell wall biosynthesis
MSIKKAGIYDRWLSTLGGGEQVAFAYAQTLAELGYKVDLITFKQVDLKKAEKKMGVSLKDINIRYLPESANDQISGISEEYDLFINTSHLDYFPNRSQNGHLSVFFPGLLKLTPIEYLKRAFFIPSFRKLFIYPSRYEGFKFDQHLKGKIYKWLSHKSSIIFKDNIKNFHIDLFLREFTFSVLDEITFSIDDQELIPVSKKIKESENVVTYFFKDVNTKNKKFTIHLPKNEYAENVALLSLTIPNFRFTLYNIFKKLFPVWEMRLHGGPGITRKSDLLSYNKIITISNFCKVWIKKYWGLNSIVLYPPVNTDNFHSSKNKKNIILHVGRFFITGHSKKQLDLVKVFKQIVNKHNIQDWELHFVGSVEEGENHRRYYEKVVSQSIDYPVVFHKDISFTQLQKLFSESKIYWHATGLDENEHKNPVALEHFGITTVEAMASGAVPVVINMGGQKEIVTQGSGFKWNSREELVDYTVKLIKNPKLLKKLSNTSIERSNFFSRNNFKKKFKEIIHND